MIRITRLWGLGVTVATGFGVALGGLRRPEPVIPSLPPARLEPAAAIPTTTSRPAALVFVGVTVVDVQNGRLHPNQTVVITGSRITAVGPARAVRIPAGARRLDARGKYLIPGLWDMHAHPLDRMDFAYRLYLVNGITGIRNASTWVSLDTVRRWQREILAGTRVGPPRQLLAGPSLDDQAVGIGSNMVTLAIRTPAEGRHAVDSLQKAGADFIKVHNLGVPAVYFAIAAEARRVGIPFSGHLPGGITPLEASDSGQHGLDHLYSWPPECVGAEASVERCRPMVARLRRNNTWLITDLLGHVPDARLRARLRYLPDSLSRRMWPADSGPGSPADFGAELSYPPSSDEVPTPGTLTILRQAGGETLVLSGTDVGAGYGLLFLLMPGFSLHDHLAGLVAAGLSPLAALRTATLNPAKFFHATDSLGTVAAGKLADLVLLDADPLMDIRNTTTIQAVVANGRYFDRAALAALLQPLEQAGDPRWR